jgi:hypothetical protein
MLSRWWKVVCVMGYDIGVKEGGMCNDGFLLAI